MKNLFFVLLLVPGFAFAAADNGSEYVWQAPAGKIEITPSLLYGKLTVAPKGGGGDNTTTGTIFGVRGEYGINEMLSVGIKLAHANLKNEYPAPTASDTNSGLGDVMFFVMGRVPAATGHFRFGADLGLALENRKIKNANADTNATSGGMSLTPFVAYEINMAPSIFGVKFSHELRLGDAKLENNAVSPSQTYKSNGGNDTELSLFFEHDIAPARLGVALEIEASARNEWKNDAGTVVSSSSPLTNAGLRFYVPYMISEAATIVPHLKYAQYTAYPSGVDSATYIEAQLQARFAF